MPELLASLFVLNVLLISCSQPVIAHGRMIEPPSRASMWRYGYDSPVDYHDNQLWCGGFMVQWEQNGGQCGVCGDDWNSTEPRDHELGGRYTSGAIVRHYKTSSIANVIIELTATHRGYFEFRICSLDGLPQGRDASWDCLNRHHLNIRGSVDKRYIVQDSVPMKHQITVDLPPGMECAHCVLQWKYNTGNSWGQEKSGKSCLGCGPQEQFFGCADVAIGRNLWRAQPYRSQVSNPPPPPTMLTQTTVTTHLPKMTTAYHLIHQTTTPPSNIVKPPNTPSPPEVVATAPINVAPPQRQFPLHPQPLKAQPLLMTTAFPYHSMMTYGRPTSDPQLVKTSTIIPSVSSPLPVARNQQQLSVKSSVDDVVGYRGETMFDGQRFIMTIYSRRSRDHPANSLGNISLTDLVPVDAKGSMYALPSWYVIVDKVRKRLSVIDPQLLVDVAAKLLAPSTSP